jgi:gliding motility-associated-like protein
MTRIQANVFWVAVLIPFAGFAQNTYYMSDMLVQECDGILFDSDAGNNPGEYAHNEDFTFTICPPNSASVTLSFSTFVTEACCDFIRFFNGPDTNSPLIATHSGSTIPGPIVATSGCLTIHFKSDANVAAVGWQATWQTVLNPPTPAQINAIPNADCSVGSITITLTQPVPCNQVNAAAFSITGPSGAVVVNAVPSPCTGGMTSTIVLTLSPGFSNNGVHTVWFDYSYTDICDSTWNFTINRNFNVVNCPINANILEGSSTICLGQCTNLLAQATGGNPAAYQYAWSHGLPPTAGPHIVCPTVTTTYSVTVSDGVSAPDQATQTIIVIPKPNAGPDMTKCRLDPQSFMVGSPAGGYWTGPGIVDTNTGLFRPWVANAGVHQLIYHLNGCTDTMIMTVLQIWAGNDQAACPGAAPFMVSFFTPGGGTWSGPNVTPAGVFNPSTIGNYTLTYTAPNGCTDQKVVRVNTITVQADDTTCVNNLTYQLIFSPIGGTWTGPGITGSNWYWGVFNAQLAGVGTHQLIYTAQGCSDTVRITVQAIQAQADVIVCPANPQFTLSATPSGGYWTGPGIIDSNGLFNPAWNSGNNFNGVAIYHFAGCTDTTVVWVRNTYVGLVSKTFCIDDNPIWLDWTNVQRDPWNGVWTGPGVTDPDLPGVFNPGVAGGGTHKLYYTANGCTDSILMIVSDPEPQPDTVVCETSPTFNLTATPAGGVWGGWGIVNGVTGAFNPQLTGLGTFRVYYTTYPNGVACTDSMNVIVDPLVTLSITGLDSVYCYGNQLEPITVSPVGGTLSGPGVVGSNFNPWLAGPGVHYIVYSYGSGNCAVFDSVRVRVRAPLSLTAVATPATMCFGEYSTINATSSGGLTTNHVINWSHGLGFGSTKSVNPLATTSYTLTLSDNCSVDDTVVVTVVVHPEVTVTVQAGPLVCYGDSGTVQVIPPPGANYSYQWSTTPPQSGTSIIAPIGYYFVTVTDNNTGCWEEVLAEIQGYGVIDASFIPNPNNGCASFLDPVIDFIDMSTGGITGTWNFGDGNSAPYSAGVNPQHTYADTGAYLVQLSIVDVGGCTADYELTVCIEPAATIFAPNGFTPNRDGLNDEFMVAGIGITEFTMRIYNRWGELLYETNDMSHGWDGTYNGELVENDVYTFLVLYKDLTSDVRKSLKGIVAVVR